MDYPPLLHALYPTEKHHTSPRNLLRRFLSLVTLPISLPRTADCTLSSLLDLPSHPPLQLLGTQCHSVQHACFLDGWLVVALYVGRVVQAGFLKKNLLRVSLVRIQYVQMAAHELVVGDKHQSRTHEYTSIQGNLSVLYNWALDAAVPFLRHALILLLVYDYYILIQCRQI